MSGEEDRRVPRATYRVQLERNFTFADAGRIVPYLARLGISHLYVSPILAARAESSHGYDVVDPTRINPELGTEADFDALVATLQAHGMGIIADIVPNHMGTGEDNPWWRDILEWGTRSPYARFFDVDWGGAGTDAKLLLPVLGDIFGTVLTEGELALAFNPAEGSFAITHAGHHFPVSPFDYMEILRPAMSEPGELFDDPPEQFQRIDPSLSDSQARSAATRLKALLAERAAADPAALRAIDAAVRRYVGIKGDKLSWLDLGRLVDRQAYRLAWWRVASEEINYRRFFDINDLAGLRIERPEVFEASHRTILDLVHAGKLDGLRIDHVDGLADPLGYLERLRGRVGTGCYIVVEKILGRREPLPAAWPVAGTTGYEVLNELTRLFIDPAGEATLTQFYDSMLGRTASFQEIYVESKRLVLQVALSSEMRRLVRDIREVAARSWETRDFTFAALREALEAIFVYLPVYRTYVGSGGAGKTDRALMAETVRQAAAAAPNVPAPVFGFLETLLTGDMGETVIVRRAQQISGPAMAKGLEDTTFYRYFRLIALNEVGGAPEEFASSPAAFHEFCRARAAALPSGMLAGSTHDTKRGEDARARIACLAGIAADWVERVAEWREINRHALQYWNGGLAPVANHEYYIYQSLIGAWPADYASGSDLSSLTQRLEAALVKAMREGKEQSSWTSPDEAYETSVLGFLRDILANGGFLADFAPFADRVAHWGALTSLSQTLIRLTMPGVPDLYRGAELWELSLVDPDNRRPVDYEPMEAALTALDDEPIAPLLPHWRDGRIKLALIARTLRTRQATPDLFVAGDYARIETAGRHAERVVGFSRILGDEVAVTLVPRFWSALVPVEGYPTDWGDSYVRLPPGTYRNALTGETLTAGGEMMPLNRMFGSFPLALLTARAGRPEEDRADAPPAASRSALPGSA